MTTTSIPSNSVDRSAKNPIHITSHDKRLLEDLLAETEPLRPESQSDLKALAEELKPAIIVGPQKVPHDVITMNSRAELVDLDTGVGDVHSRSPIAGNPRSRERLRFGSDWHVNDEFEWRVSDGVRRMRVNQIHYQPEAAAMSGR
jgi:regulator of nucleoside diphosphate kinase